MTFLRSLLAVVLGWLVSMIIIGGVDIFNFVSRLPPGDASPMEALKKLADDPQAMKAWIESMPPDALWFVLGGWLVGSFVGGLVCALIAGRARVLHAGIIGALVLVGTILNARNMKAEYDFSHPDWMLIAGLLLPMPMALLAGKLVAMVFPAPIKNPS